MKKKYEIREKFCNYLIKNIVNKMSGEGNSGKYCKYNKPSDKYNIGSLSSKPPEVENDDENEFFNDFLAKYSPYSMGMEFIGNANVQSKLQLEMSFCVYYRILPDYNSQLTLEDAKNLILMFKRMDINNVVFNIDIKDIIDKGNVTYKLTEIPELKNAFDKLYNEIYSDNLLFPDKKNINIEKDNLYSEETYNTFLSTLKSDKIRPYWNLELHIDIQERGSNQNYIQVSIINSTVQGHSQNKNYEESLFNVRLKVKLINGNIVPFVFNQLGDSFRYDREMWGMGINCTVRKDSSSEQLFTESAPIYEQERYGTREYMPKGEKLQETKFEDLMNNPIHILEKLYQQMEDYRRYCLSNYSCFIDNHSNDMELDKNHFNKNLQNFNNEVKRFEIGINILKNAKEIKKYRSIYTAFKLMNETFYEMSKDKYYNSWRPFQIVFIVSNLVDIIAQHWTEDFIEENNLDKVTVLWFATGGGKTEAYLGLLVFNLFFDRLRGKEDGTTALFKFPLRILSLQQFQRIFKIMMIANLIKEKKGIGGNLFSIGHWVGDNQTPNNDESLNARWKEDISILMKNQRDDKKWDIVQRKLLRIQSCPICNGNVEVIWSNKTNTIMHRCTNGDCSWKYKFLPVYITDFTIYRKLPSIIVSTVDKIATAGLQARFFNIMGNVKYYKKGYGYIYIKQEDSKEYKVIDDSYRKLLCPTLLVQDEVHLMKEDLGAYNSHYETMIQQIQKNITGKYSYKIIASTATIKSYNRHLSHLYGKKEKDKLIVRFPVEGPNSNESFYSVKDINGSIGRYYVGIMGHNKTHINTMVEVIYFFHREIKLLRDIDIDNFYSRTHILLSSDEEKHHLLDDYEISLNYVLTKRNADQIAESINSQIQEYLQVDNHDPINNETLTGGITPDQLFSVLKKAEVDYKDLKPENRVTSITATSMISHGVDVDRFNFIVFFGMPRQTAEYIQASSRIGRTLPGISFVVFAPQKERDQSFYKYFIKYHQYLDRLVEAPAINRWSKNSINKTFTGLLLAYIYSEYSRKYENSFFLSETCKKYFNKKKKEEKDIIKNKFTNELKKYYASENEEGENFSFVIEENINTFLKSLGRIRNKKLNEHLKREFGQSPMRSLRDTEEEIGFYKSQDLKDIIDDIQF